MRIITVLFFGLFLEGCAGPVLNEYTDYLGPTIGSVEERQVLSNLAKFVDNPWAVPGHVELSNGSIQVTNQIGIALKYPNTNGLSGANVTRSVGKEFDLTPAQTQDQEGYNLLPVTDPDDLRRLRAIYNFAVCGNENIFRREWDIADQKIYLPPKQSILTKTPATNLKPAKALAPKTVEDAVSHYVHEYFSDKSDGAAKTALINIELAVKSPILDSDKISKIDKLLEENRSRDKSKEKELVSSIIGVIGPDAVLNPETQYAAPAPTKPSTGGKSDQTKVSTGAADTIAFEDRKKDFIISAGGIGGKRWLYWSDSEGEIRARCAGEQQDVPPDPQHLVSLGVAGGHHFWTDDPRKFSDLVLFVLGGIPNTTGSHILDSGGALSAAAQAPKAGKTATLYLSNGSSITTVPSKD